MALTDITNYIEIIEKFINDFAASFREKRWVKILVTVGVVFAVFLNPTTVDYGLTLLNSRKPEWYSYLIWGVITGLLFITAFFYALLTKEKKAIYATPTVSIIKGLLPYTNSQEDAEWFAKLQRGHILQDALTFCRQGDYSFGILSGESGTGKTSFLQAGLLSNLEKLNYRPIYVKFTDAPPLESIQQSFNAFANGNLCNPSQKLSEIITQAEDNDSRSIILILDQFEQFFVHNKSKIHRSQFIQQLTEWYKNKNFQQIKILISIRGDYLNRMNEFQKEMKYTLTPYNNLSLEKFEPFEAANVIKVIADEVKIELDDNFIKELTTHEIADREDGTISPIDIQILSRMIDGQKTLEERAFNRKAFQKLGGVEGLLERFLGSTLKSLITDNRRQSAIKVLLALTDGNLRLGALSLKDLKDKLNETLSDNDIEESVLWLSRSEIRLITPIREKNTTVYELAHERIIPPLRRLASKEITEIAQTEQMLDRRVNEWLGNNRARRYLLTFKEWRLIRRNKTSIKIAVQKEQKENFILLSRKNFIRKGLIFTASVLLLFLGYSGYIRYKQYQEDYVRWYESRTETRIQRAKDRTIELLDRNKDPQSQGYALYLLASLDDKEREDFTEKLGEKVNQNLLSIYSNQYQNLPDNIIKIYKEFSKTELGFNQLDLLWKEVDEAENINIKNKLALLSGFYEVSKSNSNKAAALKYIEITWQQVEKAGTLEPSEKTQIFFTLSRNCNELSETDCALKYVELAWKLEADIPSDMKFYLYNNLEKILNELPQNEKVLETLSKVKQDRIEKGIKEPITGNGTGSGTGTGFGNGGGISNKKLNDLLIEMLKASKRLSNPIEKKKYLDKILEKLLKNSYGIDKDKTVRPLIEEYADLPYSNAIENIDKVFQQFNEYGGISNFDILILFVDSFSNLSDKEKAIDGLNSVWEIADGKCKCANRISLIMLIEKTFTKLQKTEKLLQVEDKIKRKIETIQQSIDKYFESKTMSPELPYNFNSEYLVEVSELYIFLDYIDKANKVLGQAREFASTSSDVTEKSVSLIKITKLYARLKNWDESLDTTKLVVFEPHTISALSSILIMWYDEKNNTKNIEILEKELEKSNQ